METSIRMRISKSFSLILEQKTVCMIATLILVKGSQGIKFWFLHILGYFVSFNQKIYSLGVMYQNERQTYQSNLRRKLRANFRLIC